MKIITGKTATEHVNSEDDRGLYAGIFGSGSYVLNTGTKLQASIESSTTIRINSGDLVHQGCHARIPYSEYDEVTIDAGTTGYKRIDLIVARYEKNAGLESMSLVAIKGQPATSDPVAPDYNHGNIQQGANISDMPLYKVTLDGVNIESVTPIFEAWTIGSYIYPVGSIYISVNEVNPSELFGGTWEKIQDKFLLASGSSYTIGATGGQASITYTPTGITEEHKITLEEMPAHSHRISHDAENSVRAFVDGVGGTTNILTSDYFLSNVEVAQSSGSGTTAVTPTVTGHFQVKSLGVNGETMSAGYVTAQQESHNHAFNGEEQELETMPPYLVVNVWKRTA